jgi:hypothetical protein
MDVVFDGDFLNEKLRPKEKFILEFWVILLLFTYFLNLCLIIRFFISLVEWKTFGFLF